MGKRVGASFLILFSILYFPWYFSVIFALAGMLYFKNFYEGVALIFISDLLYGAGLDRYHHIYFISTIVALLFFFGLQILKTRLKYYQD